MAAPSCRLNLDAFDGFCLFIVTPNKSALNMESDRNVTLILTLVTSPGVELSCYINCDHFVKMACIYLNF